MSQTKAQLIQPIGVVTASGVVVSGVMTAGTFDGAVVGSATSIIQGTNLNLGAFNATSFAGDFTGNATGIITSSAIKVGQLTASSFVGDFTGTATSMMRGTGFEAGAVTGSSFVSNVTGNVTGNATGLAGSVTQGTNIHVGVVTATTLYGDGSNLTGIAATNFNTQTVTINSGITTMDLSAGNVITLNQGSSTTVSFANTSEAMDVTLIRPNDGGSYNISYSTGRVQFDGTGDYLSLAASTDLQLDGDFTIEAWVYPQYSGTSVRQPILCSNKEWETDFAGFLVHNVSSSEQYNVVSLWNYNSSSSTYIAIQNIGTVPVNTWTHVACVRSSNVIKIYVNGVLSSNPVTNSDTWTFGSGESWIGATAVDSHKYTGIISNLRVVKGSAVYTSNFVPPLAALTNITNTKLLCCQSTSSTTTAAVSPGTITANGDPTADSTTVSKSGTYDTQGTITWPDSIKWDGGSAPTLITSDTATAAQQFQLLTRDSGVTWYGWEPYNNDATNWSLFAWGWNQSGGLGINSRTATSSPTQVGTDTTWTQLSTSVPGSCNSTIKSDGTLWTWGNSANGLLGLNQGPGNNQSSPCQLPGTTWKSVAAGVNFQLATKSDNTLWSWGYAGMGVLGQNSSNAHKSSPTQVGTDTTWASGKYKLSAGSVSCGVIKTDGTLWSWGYNEYGTLGQNDKTEYSSPKQVGTDITWRSIGGQYYGGVMIGTKTDGTLWAWGNNSEGMLGLNQPTPTKLSSPTQIPGTNWSEVTPYGGWQGTSVMKTDGTLWIWGNNDNGQVGQNSTNNGYSSPTQVPGTTWKECGMGDNGAVVALKTDGTAWSWGLNQQGNLGQNQADGAKYSSPTQIGSGTAWHSIQINHIESFALKSN